MGNKNLQLAKVKKNDEFYTQLTDIEKELCHYREHFKGKTVFCNCDDPEYSNFWRYFSLNFAFLGLKRLVATHYETDKQSYMLEMYVDLEGPHTEIKTLKQNGDFRSPECIEILKEADIVVTNPPFSLFREYVAQLIEYKKEYIIVGSKNAITYKEIFPLIKENKMWLGFNAGNGSMNYKLSNIPDDEKPELKSVPSYWYTNLDISKRHENLILYKQYNPEQYPHYDNYDAINVDKTKDIPVDWDGVMGVPITFLDKYNPEQFEILSCNDFRVNVKVPLKPHGLIKDKEASINGKNTYARIVIRKK